MSAARAVPAAPLVISLGDPGGIGPEIVLKALGEGAAADLPPCLVVGDRGVLERVSRIVGIPLETLAARGHHIESITSLPADLVVGLPTPLAGDAAYRYVVRAADHVSAGRARALVTAPLAKEAMVAAGHDYPGHTELLAELAGNVPVRMMLANPELRTVLVTIHVALREALDLITLDRVLQTLSIAHRSLRQFGITTPRLAVAGVNPHAGEGGLFGREELDILKPAVDQARALGIDAQGPFAPDTIFMRARGLREFDAVIAMYHDQGLIPVKYLGVEHGVNITLGLPYVRTSPDHGTAFDIAGRGSADPSSLLAAIAQADLLSRSL